MTLAIMLTLLWGATVYRIALSVRHPLTVWRTALTTAIAMANAAATRSRMGMLLMLRRPGAAGIPRRAPCRCRPRERSHRCA